MTLLPFFFTVYDLWFAIYDLWFAIFVNREPQTANRFSSPIHRPIVNC